MVGRYNFDPYKDLKLSVGFGKIKGSSANVDTFYPDYAENPYSFNHTLVDMNLVFEYNFGSTEQAETIVEPNVWFLIYWVAWEQPM